MAAHVTIPPLDSPLVYTVSTTPQSVFDITFPFFAETDIVVEVDGVEQSAGTFTVAGLYVQNGQAVEGAFGSGTLTLDAAVSSCTVIVDRSSEASRETDLSRSAPIPPAQINSDLDKLTARDSDIARTAGRALRSPRGEAGVILPSAEDRALKTFIFSADGMTAIPYDPFTGSLTITGDTVFDRNGVGKLRALFDVDETGGVGPTTDEAVNPNGLTNSQFALWCSHLDTTSNSKIWLSAHHISDNTVKADKHSFDFMKIAVLSSGGKAGGAPQEATCINAISETAVDNKYGKAETLVIQAQHGADFILDGDGAIVRDGVTGLATYTDAASGKLVCIQLCVESHGADVGADYDLSLDEDTDTATDGGVDPEATTPDSGAQPTYGIKINSTRRGTTPITCAVRTGSKKGVGSNFHHGFYIGKDDVTTSSFWHKNHFAVQAIGYVPAGGSATDAAWMGVGRDAPLANLHLQAPTAPELRIEKATKVTVATDMGAVTVWGKGNVATDADTYALGALTLRLTDASSGSEDSKWVLTNIAAGSAGAAGILDLGQLQVGGTKVVSARDTGWTAMTGTPVKTTIAAAAAGTVSASYVQAEAQASRNRIAALEARLAAYDAALFAHGLIGA